MEIVNTTPFQFAHIAGRIGFPEHSLTLIVKGTFDLKNGQDLVAANEQLFPTGDEYYPEDEEMQGSCRYESDFACFKPRADLMLVGCCHPPEGRPTSVCPVTFQVGDHARGLNIFGDRYWRSHPNGLYPSEPEMFTQMALKYENSFGGPDDDQNPVGKGCYSETETDQVWPLPNIEDPMQPVSAPDICPPPAGYGPLGRMWLTRFAKVGTYDDQWVETRWPWLAQDFDYAHFNAAPESMQSEDYLYGDEALYFENLHPLYSSFHSKLPGLRVRCFAITQEKPDSLDTLFNEVAMNLDTLWVDMENEQVILVWRGWLETWSEELDEFHHIFIMSEPVKHEPASQQQCLDRFLAALADEEAQWAMEDEPPEAAAPIESDQPPAAQPLPVLKAKPRLASKTDATDSAPDKKIDETVFKKQMSALLDKVGLDMGKLPAEARAKIEAQQTYILSILNEKDSAKKMALEQQKIDSQLNDALVQAGLDPHNLPPLSAKSKAERMRFMAELGGDATDAAPDPEMDKIWAIMAAIMPKIGLDPENLTPLIEQTKKQIDPAVLKPKPSEPPPSPVVEAPAPPILTREVVLERAGRGDAFVGENLSGLDLSQANLTHIDFSGADLSDVVFENANLEQACFADAKLIRIRAADADFSKADLSRADATDAVLPRAKLVNAMGKQAVFKNVDLQASDLRGALFENADFTQANLREASLKETDATDSVFTDANLKGADLSDGIFEQAEMKKALFEDVIAPNANFSEADLSGSQWGNADLSGADLSKAILHGVQFEGGNLSEASVEGASGHGINCAHADLTELHASEGCDFTNGHFIQAKGRESIWHSARLDGADFTYAEMEGADFSEASMIEANFYAASMKFARFAKADCTRANMRAMNLFEALFEKADLTETDLSGSNLYSAEFLNAILDETVFEDANVKMTKLATL